jgi:hypothetical protein
VVRGLQGGTEVLKEAGFKETMRGFKEVMSSFKEALRLQGGW